VSAALVTTRRGLLRIGVAAGGALLLMPARGAAAPSYAFRPHALISLFADGRVTLLARNPDMGQGVKTSLPMLIAEEMDLALDQVRIEQAGYDARLGPQGSGGSRSIPGAWEPLRRAGATARVMLISAAAQRWQLPPAQLRTERGEVVHEASGRRLRYGELAAAAALLPLPPADSVKLKPRADWRLLGSRQTQSDAAAFARGAPLFCLDAQRPGQVYAMVEKAPEFGMAPLAANLDEVRRLPGIVDAFLLEGTAQALHRHHNFLTGYCPGVALVGRSSWAVLKARQQLRVQWARGPYATESSAGQQARAEALLAAPPAQVWRHDGDVDAALGRAARVVEARYTLPALAHLTMEPMSCLAEPLPGGGLRLLTPSQFPQDVPEMLERALGLPATQVQVQIPRLGGGFGRRYESDFVLEAAVIALRLQRPVKLFYSREDDTRHDYYRPFHWEQLRAGLDAAGRLTAWEARSVAHRFRDPSTPQLRAGAFPARFIEHYRVGGSSLDSNLPEGPYRAPGANLRAFSHECFIDELAVAAGQDALAFRLALLGEDRELQSPDFSSTRMKAVLRLAAEQAGWGKPRPRGTGLGLAAYFSYGGYVAQAVEVEVSAEGQLRVRRVHAAVDVGPIVNRAGAEAQVQGSVIDALSSSLYQQISMQDGAVVEGNFDTLPLIRMPEVPEQIRVHFIERDIAPSGLGEPAFPPLPPALCNAVFAACGKRIRSLPLRLHDLSWS
jgi:isoquinoline 1-oxidoreductase beta subunit